MEFIRDICLALISFGLAFSRRREKECSTCAMTLTLKESCFPVEVEFVPISAECDGSTSLGDLALDLRLFGPVRNLQRISLVESIDRRNRLFVQSSPTELSFDVEITVSFHLSTFGRKSSPVVGPLQR